MEETIDYSERKMYIELPIIVRSYDVDYMQIVNNTVYVKWLEDMRMAILDKYFPLTEMLENKESPILAETHIQYKHPVIIGSHPIGQCWIWLIKKGRWKAEFIISECDKVYATAWQIGYYFNMDSHRPVAFPKEMIDKYLITSSE